MCYIEVSNLSRHCQKMHVHDSTCFSLAQTTHFIGNTCSYEGPLFLTSK